jgi:hypothetical protein
VAEKNFETGFIPEQNQNPFLGIGEGFEFLGFAGVGYNEHGRGSS